MKEAMETLTKYWGDTVAESIKDAAEREYQPLSMKDFMCHCTACGGNWGGMLLSGIKELYPSVYDAIPENMGSMAFACICYTMELCGVFTEEE